MKSFDASFRGPTTPASEAAEMARLLEWVYGPGAPERQPRQAEITGDQLIRMRGGRP